MDLDARLKTIQELITSNNATLSAKIDSSSAEIMKQLEAHKKEIKNLVDKKLKERDVKISAAQSSADLALARLDDAADIDRRRFNLRIDGIPNGKKDLQILTKLFHLLGYDDTTPPFEHYRQKNDGIIIKFRSEAEKETFFSRFIKIAKTLTLDKLLRGGKKDRVYVSHDLCKSQYEVHKLAMKLKQTTDKIKQVRVVSGYAMVKFSDDTPFTRFFSAAMLEDAIQDYDEDSTASS